LITINQSFRHWSGGGSGGRCGLVGFLEVSNNGAAPGEVARHEVRSFIGDDGGWKGS